MDLSHALNLPSFLLRTLGESRFRLPINDCGVGDISADGRTIIACADQRLWVLDAQTGDVRASAVVAGVWAGDVSFSCDDTRIFAAISDYTLVLDAATLATTEKVVAENGYATRAEPCPVDARRFVVCSSRVPPKLFVLSSSGAARVFTLGTQQSPLAPARCALWTSDGRAILAWLQDGLHRFDGETGEHVERMNVDLARFATVALVAEGTALLCIDYHGTPSLCELSSGRVEPLGGNVGWEAQAYAAPRGQHVIVVSREGLFVFDVRGRVWAGPAPLRATSARKSLSHSVRARVSRDESMAVIFDSRGALHHVGLDPLEVTERAPAGAANAIVFERGGGHVQVFRYTSPIERLALEGGAIERYGYAGPNNATLSPDRTRAMVSDGSGDTEVDLEARRQSEPRVELKALRALVGDAEVLADVDHLCFGRDGPKIEAPELKKRRALAVSPDGTRAFVLLQGGAVTVFDLANHAVIARWKHPGACALHAISAGELVIASSRGYVAWVVANTGEVRAKSERLGEPRALAVSDDGEVVAASAGISSLGLVARDRPDAVVRFEGGEHITALAFDASGKLLAAGGNESVVRVFDVEAALATRPPPKAPKVKKAPRAKA